MNKALHNTGVIIVTVCFTLFFLMSHVLFASSSSVLNVVRVHTSSGNSEASVKTTINGEVVEDTIITAENGEGINFESFHSTNEEYVEHPPVSLLDSNPKNGLRDALEALLELLEEYVSLLTTE